MGLDIFDGQGFCIFVGMEQYTTGDQNIITHIEFHRFQDGRWMYKMSVNNQIIPQRGYSYSCIEDALLAARKEAYEMEIPIPKKFDIQKEFAELKRRLGV